MIGKAIGDGAALGVGLAMDAFSVSMVNGLREPKMARGKILRIAGIFGAFQTAMPLIGYMMVRTLIKAFTALEPAIPWIGFALLLFLGGKMILEGIRKKKDKEEEAEKIGTGGLIVQGIATSIDALSAGLTMAESQFGEAVIEAAVIGAVTFGICVAGVRIGRKAGDRLEDKASVFGGVILVLIGIKIILGL
ncbi:MAG: manganese efflux pump [Clostridia bacterium]|nr:manganese efflux pump [Clostridia bacterium]